MKSFVQLSTATLALCCMFSQSAIGQPVRMEGASVGRILAMAAAQELRNVAKQPVALEYGASGSAGGLRRLCHNEIDVAVAARPIQHDEITACGERKVEFIELPVALDSLVVVVNRQNRFVSSVTIGELATMWGAEAHRKVLRWNQVNSSFPDLPLKLIGPDGRFERASVFAETVLGRGAQPRTDILTSVEDLVLIKSVARDVHALSYVPFATYAEHRHRLKAVAVAGFENGLTRPVFYYVNRKSLDRLAVAEFLRFALANGSGIARAARVQPLEEATYRASAERLGRRVAGTAWGGSIPVRLTASELHARQSRL
jgi:phosphate transport system substrate-binding protein